MALGTIVIVSSAQAVGPVYFDSIRVVGDSAYPTGGSPDFEGALRARVGDNREILAVVIGPSGVYVPEFDKTNDKLMVRTMVDGSEVPNATNLSGTMFNCLVISK